jgi:hypothetical protein
MGSAAVDKDLRLVEELVSSVPGFANVYDAHVADNHEVLPYVIFWDITQETVASFVRQTAEPPDWEVVLRFLEGWFEGEPEVRSLIITAFLGYLPFPGQPGHDIVEHLGVALRTRFDMIRPRG